MSWRVKRMERESGEGESMRMAAVGRERYGEEVNLECKDRRVQEERRGGRKAEEDGKVMPRLERGVTEW